MSTVILASALIVIVGIAYYAADNAVNYQVENAQFEQAQTVLQSLAEVVKNVLLNPQSSGYVRTSFWKTIPQFEKTNENLTLIITDGGQVRFNVSISQNIVKIKGGYMIGVLTPKNLLGDDNLTFPNASGSLGRVRVFQDNGAWVSLDYSRVRCVYTGSSDYYIDTDYESFNVVEITLVNLTFGAFEPETQALITVQNLGMNVSVPGGMEGLSESTIVSVSLPGIEPQTCVLSNLISTHGGNPEKPIRISVVIVNIECSMLKGG